jgi:fucose 4-O-acetylase-like acetyltransferase
MNTPNDRHTLVDLVSRNADRIKGLLILVVVADHNDWLRRLAPEVFEPLTFHVLGFLLLAFTFGEKAWGLQFVLDRVARYLVPYWWALTAASLAFALAFGVTGGTGGALVAWSLAAILGNAPYVKQASGFFMLWFLPCLFGLTCLTAIFDSPQAKRMRGTLVLVAVAAHLLIPLLPRAQMFYLPFGLGVALNIFVLGLVWRWLLPWHVPKAWGWLALLVFVASYGSLAISATHLEIATLDMAGIDRPGVLLLQDLAGMSGVLSVVWLAEHLDGTRWLAIIGQHSLLAYLGHPFAYVMLGKLGFGPTGGDVSAPAMLLYGCLTGGVALGLALGVAIAVARSRLLSMWIVPRAWRQWPPGCYLS